jgi:two-component system KDP operon response regulator KdpE
VSRRLRIDDACEPTLLQAGDLLLDINRHMLYRQGKPVHLTPTEFELLALLMRNQGVPVTHAKLLRSVWGPEYGTELDYLRSFVKTLRQKVEEDPAKPKYIVTELWVGYRFCNPLDGSPAVPGGVSH